MEQIQIVNEKEYSEILRRAVAVLDHARARVAKQICSITSDAYWQIGQLLYEKKIESGYGNGVVKRLSADLKSVYPDMGVSPRNLWDMKKYYERFRLSSEKVRHAVAVLPWGHILLLMRELKEDEAILYYATETINKFWNRELLINAIKLEMYKKETLPSVDNNFALVLPSVQSEYANEIFKSGYNLGFLGVTTPLKELELERRLVEKIKLFLLELGRGFTYIGNQYTLVYNGKESRVDMLFYHRVLRSMVAIDLKVGEFKPEYVGKMNYYLSLLDRLERIEGENPSIGIILCASKDHVEVELALDGITKPIGVADYQLIFPQEQLQQTIIEEFNAYIAETDATPTQIDEE